MIKGVIIDFNGTLFLDHDLNRKAWGIAFDSVKPKGSNENFSVINRANRPNNYLVSKAILEHFNIEPTEEAIHKLADFKESAYQNAVVEVKRDSLVKGVPLFIKYLRDHGIPYCIASMAPKTNFDFYFRYLHLGDFFSYDNIVYDDGTYFNKNSQIIDAAKRMNLDVRDCLIVEDTPENINLAIEKLGTDKFIYFNSRNMEYSKKEILQEIKDYTEIDYKIFNN